MTSVVENTAKLLDAVNSGDVDELRYVLTNLDFDINLDVEAIAPYATSEIPIIDVDIINRSRDIWPDKILGCAAVQPNLVICQMLFDICRDMVLTNNDAVICIYHSTRAIHRLITRKYPTIMINKRMLLSSRGAGLSLGIFFPMLLYTFTPLHAILLSFFIHREASMYIGNTFIQRQIMKMEYMVQRGAVLDGINNRRFKVLGQLLIAGEINLVKNLLESRILHFRDNICREYLRKLISLRLRDSIMFMVHDHVCKKNKISGYVGQELLLDGMWNSRFLPKECEKWTEFFVHNQFVLGAQNYVIRFRDTPSRLYNLFRAGVYLRDQINYIPEMDQSSRIVQELVSFVEQSKSPFRLDFLCRLVIKREIGPTEHFSRIKSLSRCRADICVPRPILEFLSTYKYTVKGRLINPDRWMYPISWRRAPVRYTNV